jgi:hypothetical protein
MEGLLEYDRFDPDSREGQILQRLKNNRPASIKKAKQLEKEEAAARDRSEVVALIAQFRREHPEADQRRLPILATAEWFLNSPGRWPADSVKNYARALKREIEGLLEFDTFDPDSTEAQILRRLENNRPAPLKAPRRRESRSRSLIKRRLLPSKRKRRRKKRRSVASRCR